MTATETETERPPAVPVGRAGVQPTARRWLPVVLGVVLLVSIVLVGVLAWRAVSATRMHEAQDAAMAAARDEIPRVLSYSAASLDADFARARSLVSGTFAAQFNELTTQVVGPAIRQQGLSTKATVLHSAVVDTQPDQVKVLLFVKQSTAASGQPPNETINQLQATMSKVNGTWLISDVQAL